MERTPWAPGATTLAEAADALRSILNEGRSADAALASSAQSAQRAAVRAITLGTVRWHFRLAPALDTLLARPRGLDPSVRALLLTAAHQIEYSRNAPEHTVHAAVDAARALRQERATGLVNAVLRRFVRERSELLRAVDATLAGRTAHPAWLVQALEQAWPDAAVEVLTANNEHPPMTLRVDTGRVSCADYLEMLAAAGMKARSFDFAPAALCLDEPVPVEGLPGFAEGLVSVQDVAAQLAAPLLHAHRGMRILDACAAPGGKTAHLLELLDGGAELVAVDADPERARRIEEGLARLRRSARVVVADIRAPGPLGGLETFDRILLDAPCSATGVIRRHPDIKLLRRATDIPTLARGQLAMLRALGRRLSPGGRLVYSTCSVLPAENAEVVRQALELEPQLRLAPIDLDLPSEARDAGPGVQLLPGGAARTDGFYYACLEKTTDLS